MSFKEWIIKTFNKSKAVIVYLKHENKRVTKHWCLLNNDNTVKITGLDFGVVISNESTYLTTKWNIPTYFVDYKNCETINLDNPNESQYSAEEFSLILDNDEAGKIFRSTQSGVLSQENMIILVAIILGFIATFYFFNTKLVDITNRLPEPTPIVETVEEDINE